MARAFWGVVLTLGVCPATRAESILLQNKSPQPLVYQIRLGGNDSWSDPYSVPSGWEQAIPASNPVTIRLRNGKDWMTYHLAPGKVFRYQPDGEGGNQLLDAGAVQDVPTPRPSAVQGPLGDVGVQTRVPARPDLKLREIKVLCLADESYRRRFPAWKDRIAEIVSRASRDFEAAFALRFAVADCRAWSYEPKNVGDPQEQIARLVAVDPAPADLVIALVGVIQSTNTNLSGHLYYQQAWSFPFGQHVMVSDINQGQTFAAEQLLVRSLCSVLGAFSVADRRSIMNSRLENIEPGPIRFGSVTEQVILLTRDFDFRSGPGSLTPEAVSKIRSLYKRYRHVESMPGDDPVTNGYRAREFYKKDRRTENSRAADMRSLASTTARGECTLAAHFWAAA